MLKQCYPSYSCISSGSVMALWSPVSSLTAPRWPEQYPVPRLAPNPRKGPCPKQQLLFPLHSDRIESYKRWIVYDILLTGRDEFWHSACIGSGISFLCKVFCYISYLMKWLMVSQRMMKKRRNIWTFILRRWCIGRWKDFQISILWCWSTDRAILL